MAPIGVRIHAPAAKAKSRSRLSVLALGSAHEALVPAINELRALPNHDEQLVGVTRARILRPMIKRAGVPRSVRRAL